MSFVLSTNNISISLWVCGGVCMFRSENLPPSCRSSADAAFILWHHDHTAGAHRKNWLSLNPLVKSLPQFRPFTNVCSTTIICNYPRAFLLSLVIFALCWHHSSNKWKVSWPQNILALIFFSQQPKVRNVFNLDFPDSNHLAKTLTIVSGPDTVNLTYHNFFACKEKVTQVINYWIHSAFHTGNCILF